MIRRIERARRRDVRRRRDQRGSGLLPAVFGVAIVIGFIGFASNVAIGLWVRSTVDAAAYDAARRVATAPEGSDLAEIEAQAVADAQRTLGDFGTHHVRMAFRSSPSDIVLHLDADGISLLPAMIAGGGPVVGGIDRLIVVHREIG